MYAIIKGIPGWKRGDRKEFIVGSVKSTAATKISVLGHNGEVVEYRPGADAQPRFTQQHDGLHISVVRGQRIYNDHKWPNPIAVKLEYVVPEIPGVKNVDK